MLRAVETPTLDPLTSYGAATAAYPNTDGPVDNAWWYDATDEQRAQWTLWWQSQQQPSEVKPVESEPAAADLGEDLNEYDADDYPVFEPEEYRPDPSERATDASGGMGLVVGYESD